MFHLFPQDRQYINRCFIQRSLLLVTLVSDPDVTVLVLVEYVQSLVLPYISYGLNLP